MNKSQKQNMVGVLYLIGKPNDRVFKYRIRLQKFVLLAQKEFGYPFYFDYQSHYYGPYSEELQFFISNLVQLDYIQEFARELPNGNFEFSYSLTDQGKKKLKELSVYNKTDLRKIDLLWTKYNDKPTISVVAAAKVFFSRSDK